VRFGRDHRRLPVDIPAGHWRGRLTLIGMAIMIVALGGLLIYLVTSGGAGRAGASPPPPTWAAAWQPPVDIAGIASLPTGIPPTQLPDLLPRAPDAPPPGWVTPTPGPTSEAIEDEDVHTGGVERGDPEPVEAWRYWLTIPAIDLQAPVVETQPQLVQLAGGQVWRLAAPKAFAISWDATSAPVGAPGNTVMTGHNNVYGEVFGDLYQLSVGDDVYIYAEFGIRHYRVDYVVTVEERMQPMNVRLEHGQWVAPTRDERLTLITCWPWAKPTHRVIVIARPVD
jgi:sortase A